jgi:hypothetical protein
VAPTEDFGDDSDPDGEDVLERREKGKSRA